MTKHSAFRKEQSARASLDEQMNPPVVKKGDDESESLMFRGASKTYSISLRSVYCILPSTLRTNGGRSGYAFCIGLDDGSTCRAPEVRKKRASTSSLVQPSSPGKPRTPSVESVVGGSHVARSGEFLHILSKPCDESVDLDAKVHMLTALLDTEADGFINLWPAEDRHFVLEPTLLRL